MRIAIVTCPCGHKIETERPQRTKYCSKKCFYRYRTRPSGLTYAIKKKNKGWFKTSQKTWNTGTKGVCIAWNKGLITVYRKKNVHGYWMNYTPKHPYADKDGFVLEHRLVVENNIRRYLQSQEIVHHFDLNRDNNDINNLIILTRSEHSKIHNQLRLCA